MAVKCHHFQWQPSDLHTDDSSNFTFTFNWMDIQGSIYFSCVKLLQPKSNLCTMVFVLLPQIIYLISSALQRREASTTLLVSCLLLLIFVGHCSLDRMMPITAKQNESCTYSSFFFFFFLHLIVLKWETNKKKDWCSHFNVTKCLGKSLCEADITTLVFWNYIQWEPKGHDILIW